MLLFSLFIKIRKQCYEIARSYDISMLGGVIQGFLSCFLEFQRDSYLLSYIYKSINNFADK